MLTYKRSDKLEDIGYSDSSFAGCQDSMKSTLAIYLLAKGVVSWKSYKHTLIAPSITEAKFKACYEAFNHGIWLQKIFTDFE